MTGDGFSASGRTSNPSLGWKTVMPQEKCASRRKNDIFKRLVERDAHAGQDKIPEFNFQKPGWNF
jgi:hypothetical protein